MIAIFKREIKNYLKRPLFWVGILLVIYGVFNTTSPYLMTHYLGQGEKIVNDYPDTVRLGDVYEGYIPANPEKHREIWSGQIKQALIDELEMSDLEAQSVMSKLVDMELEEAFVYLEEKYDWYSAFCHSCGNFDSCQSFDPGMGGAFALPDVFCVIDSLYPSLLYFGKWRAETV